MSWDAFSETLLLLILASFVVERSLAVLFETNFYINKFGTSKLMKPIIAIIYAMIFVTVVDINLAYVINQSGSGETEAFHYTWTTDALQVAYNAIVIAISGIFIAGGSKASLKLFRDVWNIKSTEESMRRSEIKPAPANPVKAAEAAAGGNTAAEIMLYNLFDESRLPKS